MLVASTVVSVATIPRGGALVTRAYARVEVSRPKDIAWVFLSQVQDDATWTEICFARDAVAMCSNVNLNAVYHQLRKLERDGFLIRGSGVRVTPGAQPHFAHYTVFASENR